MSWSFPRLPEAVENLPPQIRYRARNCLTGFDRARALFDLDREIASFRAITAEEEGAAALIRSLQLRNYSGSEKLDLRKHQHKVAVIVFLGVVGYALVADGKLDVTVTLDLAKPAMTVALPVEQFGVQVEGDLHIVLDQPLGGFGSKPGTPDDEYFDAAVARVAGDRKVDKMIASEANARNKLLYAHDGGAPKSRATLQSIDLREGRARLCLLLAIAVMQEAGPQSFAEQCLAGLLRVLDRTKPLNST